MRTSCRRVRMRSSGYVAMIWITPAMDPATPVSMSLVRVRVRVRVRASGRVRVSVRVSVRARVRVLPYPN